MHLKQPGTLPVLFVAAILILTVSFQPRLGDAAPISPSDEIRQAVKEIKAILDNPTIKGADKRLKVRNVILPLFDIEEMAKHALGYHWKDNSDRMDEFIPLFIAVIEKSYLNLSMLEAAVGMQVVVLKEKLYDDRAEVYTRLTTPKISVDMVYKLRKNGEGWLIYDIVVENFSLVANYRSQFNEVITTYSFDELLKRMREKVSASERR